MTPIVVEGKKSKYILAIVCGALFSLLCVFVLFVDITEGYGRVARLARNSEFAYFAIKALFAVGILFFAFSAFWLYKKMKEAKPIMTVDENGITDNSSAIAFGFIPWSDIAMIGIEKLNGKDTIAVTLKNEDAYIEKLSAFKQHAVRANIAMGYPPVMIQLGLSSVKVEEVLSSMRSIVDKIKSN